MRGLGVKEPVKFRGCGGNGIDAGLLEPPGNLGVRVNVHDLSLDFVDDGRGRSSRRHQPDPA